jgi:hypothetical protein
MLKLVTYNIHKGVQAPGSGLGLGGSLSLGLGWGSRLEIHNIARAVASLDADVVCLQEVRSFNHQLARRFQHWPEVGQAQALAPQGYHVIYQTNARTRHGEHGNALLSRWPIESHRHEDISDHALEQRGVLQVKLNVRGRALHVVVVHLGLFAASRLRQIEHIKTMIAREIPADEALIVAGDFNDWPARLHRPLGQVGLQSSAPPALKTFPARWPVLALDRVYARGLETLHSYTPQGSHWPRLSDHLPLITEFKSPWQTTALAVTPEPG